MRKEQLGNETKQMLEFITNGLVFLLCCKAFYQTFKRRDEDEAKSHKRSDHRAVIGLLIGASGGRTSGLEPNTFSADCIWDLV